MYLARELTSLSLAEIARGFDRDHTTVMHAIRAVSGRLEPGSETAAAIHRIHATLGNAADRRRIRPPKPGHDPPLGASLIHRPRSACVKPRSDPDPQPSTKQIHLIQVGR